MTDRARIVEVGPRDGLQNEPRRIATSDKIRLVDALSACGFEMVEATSFVSAKWVPQLGDAAEVMAGVARRAGVRLAALTPNLQGYAAARAAQVDVAAVFAAASEGFSRANLNCSIDESFERFAPVFAAAAADGRPVRGYVSCVVRCPYDGATPPAAVARVVERLLKAGAAEVSLGDTIGAGTPASVSAMLDAVLAVAPPDRLAGHFHDTGDGALANIEASLDRGLRVFDASIAGLGGCPYAPGARGNVDTAKVAARLAALGLETGLDAAALTAAEALARRLSAGEAP